MGFVKRHPMLVAVAVLIVVAPLVAVLAARTDEPTAAQVEHMNESWRRHNAAKQDYDDILSKLRRENEAIERRLGR